MKKTGRAPRALIIEDEGLTVMQMRQALTAAGYDVLGEANDGSSGCDLARDLEPDFILMDVNLQGMNGIEAARRIMRERPTTIIMLTAYGDDKTVDEALEAGACYYLVKPIVGAQLIPAVKTAMARFDAMEVMRHENEDLKDQLEARKLLERAKGILMERMQLTEEEAFRRLKKTARDRCQTMKETARAIIEAQSILS